MAGNEFGEDDETRVDFFPAGLEADETDTPVDVEACRLCGAVCVIDDFDWPSLTAFPEHCIRAKDSHWWWCSRFKETNRR